MNKKTIHFIHYECNEKGKIKSIIIYVRNNNKSKKSYAIKRLLLSFLPNEILGILLKSLVQNMEYNGDQMVIAQGTIVKRIRKLIVAFVMFKSV